MRKLAPCYIARMSEQDYVLGTHDKELARLGLQHAVWRPRATDAWRRGGFTRGQTLMDVGCGPGYATTELSEIAGPDGRVHALDRSQRFLDAVNERAVQRGANNISTRLVDFDQDDLPDIEVDGAWIRWVLCFVQKPQRLLQQIVERLRPGGALVIHEYFAYSTWVLMPEMPEIEEIKATVMRTWREAGGEPNIGLQVPGMLNALGMEVQELRPIIDVVPASNIVWQWPAAYIEVGLDRMMDLGEITRPDGARILAAFHTAQATPGTLMVTPGVLEVIAKKA